MRPSRLLVLKTSSAVTIRNQALMQAMETIRRRVDALGVTEPTIAEYGQGDFELVVQLPGVDDPSRVKDIMQSTALLELKLVQDGPYPSREAALAAHGGVLPPDTELVAGLERENGNETWYVLNRIAAVTGRDLTGADPSHDQAGRPSVNFTLNRDGAERFGRVTGANINKLLAIVLDNRVYSAPEIHGQITDRGEITGDISRRSRPGPGAGAAVRRPARLDQVSFGGDRGPLAGSRFHPPWRDCLDCGLTRSDGLYVGLLSRLGNQRQCGAGAESAHSCRCDGVYWRSSYPAGHRGSHSDRWYGCGLERAHL